MHILTKNDKGRLNYMFSKLVSVGKTLLMGAFVGLALVGAYSIVDSTDAGHDAIKVTKDYVVDSASSVSETVKSYLIGKSETF